MKNRLQEVYVFGGVYFVSDDIINILKERGKIVTKYLPSGMSFLPHIMTEALEWVSVLLFVAFIILLLRYVLTSKTLSFIQKIIRKYPKISLYLYYFGLVGYILFFVNILFFSLGYFISIGEELRKVLVYGIVILNICGFILPLILATYNLLANSKIHK